MTLFTLSTGAWIWSYVLPSHSIQYLQTLPNSMLWKSLPSGTWLGSQRRYVGLSEGHFTGTVGMWWDLVPPPTPASPSQLMGMGGGVGRNLSPYLIVHTVPSGYDSNGVSKGTVVEWIVPIWMPTLVSGFLIACLFAQEFLLVFTFRSRRRKRLGLCAKCGYDLAGLPAVCSCPECATANNVAA